MSDSKSLSEIKTSGGEAQRRQELHNLRSSPFLIRCERELVRIHKTPLYLSAKSTPYILASGFDASRESLDIFTTTSTNPNNKIKFTTTEPGLAAYAYGMMIDSEFKNELLKRGINPNIDNPYATNHPPEYYELNQLKEKFKYIYLFFPHEDPNSQKWDHWVHTTKNGSFAGEEYVTDMNVPLDQLLLIRRDQLEIDETLLSDIKQSIITSKEQLIERLKRAGIEITPEQQKTTREKIKNELERMVG